VVAPLHLATTFERAGDLSYPSGYVYSRWANPTRTALERALADLDEGDAAFAFSSGMAALDALLKACPRGYLVMPSDTYHGLRALVSSIYEPWGLRAATVDTRNVAAVEAAVRAMAARRAADVASGAAPADAPPVLLHLESPSNPNMYMTDLRACIAAGHAHGALVSVDATWMTPLLCRPLELGADVVVHSTTKYMAGHSDCLSGALVVSHSRGGADGAAAALTARLSNVQRVAGAVAAPFDAYLVLRGLRSLAPRMRTHCASAAALASFLASHPACVAVYYPGLPGHPGHALAARDMRLPAAAGTAESSAAAADGTVPAYGGMVSVRIAGGRDGAVAAIARLRVFKRATSLGGTESLVEHRESVEGAGSSTPVDLVRISVGLEDVHDLIEDWTQALQPLLPAAT